MAGALLFGASFAVRKDFTSHRNVMTFLVIVNWFSIFGRMAPNVQGYLDESDPTFSQAVITLHAIGGALVMILASYLITRMWFEKVLPERVLVKNFKVFMRLTLVFWLSLIALGTFMYFDIYG
jgi:uncharacterized membrane protein YozB (DUF420 family)